MVKELSLPRDLPLLLTMNSRVLVLRMNLLLQAGGGDRLGKAKEMRKFNCINKIKPLIMLVEKCVFALT